MNEIVKCLEEITHLAKSSGDASKIKQAIQKTRETLSSRSKNALLQKLDAELSTWQSKLDVILKEPIGREGMAKHAKHWIGELCKTNH